MPSFTHPPTLHTCASVCAQAFTGGSTTSEGACQAVRACCETLVSRLKANADAKQLGDSYTWAELIAAAGGMFAGFPGDVRLIAHEEGMGTPAGEGAPAPQIMYDTYGAGVAVVEVDALTGDRRVLSVDLLYDTGKTLNPAVDLGQTEGAFVFGLGNLLTEAVGVDPEFGTNRWGKWEGRVACKEEGPKREFGTNRWGKWEGR
eukprot:166542-Chlamydomonas_euryale.AAC.4